MGSLSRELPPFSFLTSFSLLRLMEARSLLKEPLRFKDPVPSWKKLNRCETARVRSPPQTWFQNVYCYEYWRGKITQVQNTTELQLYQSKLVSPIKSYQRPLKSEDMLKWWFIIIRRKPPQYVKPFTVTMVPSRISTLCSTDTSPKQKHSSLGKNCFIFFF